MYKGILIYTDNSIHYSFKWIFQIPVDMLYRRQIDITTYQIRKIKADTLLCLFADDMVKTSRTVKQLTKPYDAMVNKSCLFPFK